MIDVAQFHAVLSELGIDHYVGVPDSLLQDFCGYLHDHDLDLIAANEGNAASLALGYHLATGRIAACYLQNSGLGHVANPALSLMHPDVYGTPVLLLIGWRGEPGRHDEPQHVAQGRLTEGLLESAEIEHAVLPDTIEKARESVARAVAYMREKSAPFALLIRRGTFGKYQSHHRVGSDLQLSRENALEVVLPLLEPDAAIVCTTGKLSRELFELRKARGEGHERDFLTVGGMGHASSIALGVALQTKGRPVYCLDGDGALIMHMGALAVIGNNAPANYRHIVFNNGSHESVGGQPTVGRMIDLPAIARACGYRRATAAKTAKQLAERLGALQSQDGPWLLEILVASGSRADLGRPGVSPRENKHQFMKRLR